MINAVGRDIPEEILKISRLALHSCDQSLYRHPSCAWRRRRIALPLNCSIGSMQSCRSCLKRQSPNILDCHITLLDLCRTASQTAGGCIGPKIEHLFEEVY